MNFIESAQTQYQILVFVSIAISQLVLAVGVTFLALIVLRGVPFIERRFGLRKQDNR